MKNNGLEQLKNRIFSAAEQMTPDMLARVFRATEERWDMCFDLRGHHVEMNEFVFKMSKFMFMLFIVYKKVFKWKMVTDFINTLYNSI